LPLDLPPLPRANFLPRPQTEVRAVLWTPAQLVPAKTNDQSKQAEGWKRKGHDRHTNNCPDRMEVSLPETRPTEIPLESQIRPPWRPRAEKWDPPLAPQRSRAGHWPGVSSPMTASIAPTGPAPTTGPNQGEVRHVRTRIPARPDRGFSGPNMRFAETPTITPLPTTPPEASSAADALGVCCRVLAARPTRPLRPCRGQRQGLRFVEVLNKVTSSSGLAANWPHLRPWPDATTRRMPELG